MLLARKGYRVLLVDRASFPSDTISCHFLHQPGVASLERRGLLPEVVGSNCPPVRSQALDVGPIVLEGAAAAAGDVTDAYAIRRTFPAASDSTPRSPHTSSAATKPPQRRDLGSTDRRSAGERLGVPVRQRVRRSADRLGLRHLRERRAVGHATT
jgi:hypothetical protein